MIPRLNTSSSRFEAAVDTKRFFQIGWTLIESEDAGIGPTRYHKTRLEVRRSPVRFWMKVGEKGGGARYYRLWELAGSTIRRWWAGFVDGWLAAIGLWERIQARSGGPLH